MDRSFVKDIPEDENDVAIAKAIIALGNAVGMDIIAEGAATQQQYEFLLKEKCKYTQGFLFSEPLPNRDFKKFFIEHFSR